MLLLQVQKDMFRETGRKLGRAAVATICATTLAMPSVAMATEPEGPQPSTAETSEELNSQAQKHAAKAIEHFNNGAFVDSEEEFRRVAFFAPNWRPLHFNLAVLAEAQGKLGTAVSEYKEFRPHGSPDEQLVVDQRLDELGRRKMKISGAYKRQIALSATTMTLGLGSIGGAAALFAIMVRNSNRAEEYSNAADQAEAMIPDYESSPDYQTALQQQADDFRAEATDLTKRRTGMLYGGVYLAIFGLLLTAYSIIPLRNAIKSKRQLDGINLGKTRLKWNGGAGVTLRF
ncbi:hypothetical protein OV079_25615 [Nannocystis pusilla]|uniref:Tetratricopeptide repeat protein n=1 Tax=Nannocystis pusilla TaxID=889268 RepID=A0A9X3ET07_9BACT|nr:hypothetical protein [Nannocystis pusilla]MCY1008874.1 hypothetical protein [Nannocystis pusilla]